jgi:hypothetical protein
MADRAAVVVDAALWSRASRERDKVAVEQAGGRRQLIYLKVALDVLRTRLQTATSFEANAPFPITEDILARYAVAFEGARRRMRDRRCSVSLADTLQPGSSIDGTPWQPRGLDAGLLTR